MEKQDLVKAYFNAKSITTTNATKIKNLERNVRYGACTKVEYDTFYTIAPKGSDFLYIIEITQ